MELTRRDLLRLAGAAGVAYGAGPSAAALLAADAPQAGTLIRRAIPSSGELLPVVGLGTSRVFNVTPSASELAPLREVVRELVAAGGEVVDTSPMYGHSEDVVGRLSAELALRPKLFLATKVWTSGKEAGIRQMEESMRKLGASTIDLMQVHNLLDTETHLATLREWKGAGRIRYVGATHWERGAHDDVEKLLRTERLDVVQINYSVAEREVEQRILPLAREKGVAVLVNRPFARGGLLKRLSGKPLPSFAAEIGCTSWAQILLKFVVSHPAVTCAIPATSKASHMRDNMNAARGALPDEALRKRIAEAAA